MQIAEIRQVFEDEIRRLFPLHTEMQRVEAKALKLEQGESRRIWVGQWERPQRPEERGCTFHVNLIDDICYLLWIHLPKHHRGQGHGDALYRAIEQAGCRCGCTELRQTPSGCTGTNADREAYLQRRGYSRVPGTFEVRKFLKEGA